MEAVKLKNGAEEADVMVKVTMMSLRSLINENPIAFYELVEVARDRDHKPSGNTGEILKDLSLLESVEGRMHDSVRNIVLSAVSGDDLEMTLGNPLAS